jgi:hypothetical protein
LIVVVFFLKLKSLRGLPLESDYSISSKFIAKAPVLPYAKDYYNSSFLFSFSKLLFTISKFFSNKLKFISSLAIEVRLKRLKFLVGDSILLSKPNYELPFL